MDNCVEHYNDCEWIMEKSFDMPTDTILKIIYAIASNFLTLVIELRSHSIKYILPLFYLYDLTNVVNTWLCFGGLNYYTSTKYI